ncbi:COG4223 family protein [Acidimangrovimonas pyrenivorans]|uniref:COG4223 family protein n=1 Tax=Acidimangrovimonas pyrenivorans TaxID=2030798 RepID=A0ABV7AKR4_9RHOB
MAGRKTSGEETISGEDIAAPETPESEAPDAEPVAAAERQPDDAEEIALPEPEDMAEEPVEAEEDADADEMQVVEPEDRAEADDSYLEDDYVDDDYVEPEPEPGYAPEPEVEAPPPPAPPQVIKRGPGFFPLVLGGIVAAGIGFAGAQYLGPQGWLPFGPAGQDTAALKATLADQAAAIAALQDGVKQAQAAADAAKTAAAQVPASDAGPRIDALKQALSAEIETNKTALAKLDERLTAVEKRPAAGGDGVSGSALGAYERDVQALRDKLQAESDKTAALAEKVSTMSAEVDKRIAAADAAAQAAKDKAAADARAATARGALMRLEAALDAGGSFIDPVAELQKAGVTVPEALSGAAETGVPTLADLQQSFPEAARTALAASIPETMGDSVTGRIAAFLQAQTGARSLTPRPGDSPDAVLSRAEAALRGGKPADAVEMLKALPEAGQKKMADWVAQAQTRIDALDAARQVAAGLNGK